MAYVRRNSTFCSYFKRLRLHYFKRRVADKNCRMSPRLFARLIYDVCFHTLPAAYIIVLLAVFFFHAFQHCVYSSGFFQYTRKKKLAYTAADRESVRGRKKKLFITNVIRIQLPYIYELRELRATVPM